MRPTKRCVVLWGVAVLLWVFSFAVAVWVAHPGLPHPWWVEVFRGPVWSAAVAGYAVSLVLHHLLGERGTMFRVAVEIGREEERENARKWPNVIPIPRRPDWSRSSSSSS